MKNLKRVLYFSRDYSTHDHRFLTSLSETNFEVYYLRLENRNDISGSFTDKVNILPVLNKGKPFNYTGLAKIVNKLQKIYSQIKPDLVHAGPIQSCAFLAALSGFSPLVSMSWGSDLLVDSEKNNFMRWATKYTLGRSSLLLGDCQVVKEKAKEFGFPEEKIILFPWGIDLNLFKPGQETCLRDRLGWQDNFVLLSLRSFEKIYGVEVVARAVARVVTMEPNIRLILLGKGSLENEIKDIFEQAGIIDKIFFGGSINQSDLPAIYQSADLYLSASYSDGSSVSLMEALASGLPVLVSDIPGNKEWIENGKNGWLFKSGDEEDLARMILEIYKTKSDDQSIRLAARETALKKANWDLNFQKLLNAYQNVLQQKPMKEGISG